MLADVVARGVPADRSLLVVIDGGKGLRKAVNDVLASTRWSSAARCIIRSVPLSGEGSLVARSGRRDQEIDSG